MDKTDNLKTALRCFGFALIMLLSSLTAVAQSKLVSKVTLDESKATVETILKKIETQTGLSVVISTEQAKKMPLISITAHGKSVKQVLDEIADKANCAYKVSGEIVTMYMPSKRIVSGVVMDEKGEPLVGVQVMGGVKKPLGITDAEGRYSFSISTEQTTLRFSYVGMKAEIAEFPKGTKNITRKIIMHDGVQLDDVVVNGIYERKKESFTGAATVVQKEELMRNGSQNLLQNLKNIDPSFKIVDNMELGSDPNKMPEIQMRGQQSLTDVNGTFSDDWSKEQYLNNIMKSIASGVDTDWLAQPLRTGIGHRHSVYLEGGDKRLRYGVDLLYNDLKGVMKGSDRKTFTGGFSLSYRYKSLLFRNQFNVTLNHADNSPYGSFSEYATLNPYWSPYDETGALKQIAGSTGCGGLIGVTVGNPMWNATIGTKDFSKYTGLSNNFYIEWQALKTLKLIGRFSLAKTISKSETFYPASHTKFLNYSEERFFEKGEYGMGNGESSSYSADLTANYSLLLNKHQLYLNAGYSIKEERSQSTYFQVIGFPNERTGFITSGLGFAENYRPSGGESISRELGLLTALNYSYDDRYLLDATYRANASSRFGKDKRWGGFWSAGIGWNLHKEHFMKDARWLRQFKLRASTGYTGSQNFNPYQALATFNYYQDKAYDNWVGSYLIALPNDDLKWQKTKDYNVGFDLNIFNRLTVRYDYYIQRTSDQLLSLTIPPSMGFTSYRENLGSTENKGMELRTSVNILLDPKRDRYITANFSIAHNKNKLKKISNALKAQNDAQDKDIMDGKTNKPRTRFIEGQSMNAIWAVRSLGIDPATGNELYLTKDGKTTTEWRTEYQVVCGDAMPKCSGSFGLNMDYRGIFCNVSFYYQFGGQTYNQTLVDRVENAYIALNVDKRIYDSVWRQPGDKVNFAYSPYKTTKPSSRFVQDLDELRLSTLNIGYDFRHHDFVKKIGLERLKASFYMDDVFRLSTVKAERGLTYPFARTYSLSLQATF